MHQVALRVRKMTKKRKRYEMYILKTFSLFCDFHIALYILKSNSLQ